MTTLFSKLRWTWLKREETREVCNDMVNGLAKHQKLIIGACVEREAMLLHVIQAHQTGVFRHVTIPLDVLADEDKSMEAEKFLREPMRLDDHGQTLLFGGWGIAVDHLIELGEKFAEGQEIT